ncbi:hypothetical protein ES705_09384 [subsurface metagenome]
MGRVNNETNLIVALLKEKAKTQKDFLGRMSGKDKELERQDIRFREGVDWTLKTLDEIIQDEIVKK